MGSARATVNANDDHTAKVAALAKRYASLSSESLVRLKKSTSNLFRFRSPAAENALDVSALDQVIDLDVAAQTVNVEGMATYEHVVDVLLRRGQMPAVVPQLKTITVGGAVAGLGIESTSFRNGLPHESVREMEILTGAGDVVVARADNEHAELFRGFPNSYGTLGYLLRVTMDVEPCAPFVRLRHVHFGTAEECARAVSEICRTRAFEGHQVDFLDGTVFGANELYLTIGTFVDEAPITSDYTGQRIYYQSIRRREADHLRTEDYLWRWDTDWFWCSRAFGVQHPLVRRFWPRKYRRSNVYRDIVAWDRRYEVSRRINRALGKTPTEPVIQDVEVPVDRLGDFLRFFHREIGIVPIWLCPITTRAKSGWPLYPMDPSTLYVNVGFWSSVPLTGGRSHGWHNRAIERAVREMGGHKSLYSTSYYTEAEFWSLYNQSVYQRLKMRYDPARRLPGLYEKCVGER